MLSRKFAFTWENGTEYCEEESYVERKLQSMEEENFSMQATCYLSKFTWRLQILNEKKMQRLNCAQLIGDRTGRDLASQQDFQPLLDLGKQFNEWMSRLEDFALKTQRECG